MSDVNCPHCGKDHDTTDWIEYFTHDGDRWVEECLSCEEEFDVVARLSVSYEVSKSEVKSD